VALALLRSVGLALSRTEFPIRQKWPGREADHSLPSSAAARNGGDAPPLPWHTAYSVV
jgi:hypothetical protein